MRAIPQSSSGLSGVKSSRGRDHHPATGSASPYCTVRTPVSTVLSVTANTSDGGISDTGTRTVTFPDRVAGFQCPCTISPRCGESTGGFFPFRYDNRGTSRGVSGGDHRTHAFFTRSA